MLIILPIIFGLFFYLIIGMNIVHKTDPEGYVPRWKCILFVLVWPIALFLGVIILVFRR